MTTLQRYPNTGKFRKKPLQFSEELDILFPDTPLSGERNVPLEPDAPNESVEDDMGAMHPSEPTSLNISNGEKQCTESDVAELFQTLYRIIDAVERSAAASARVIGSGTSIPESMEKLSSIPGVRMKTMRYSYGW